MQSLLGRERVGDPAAVCLSLRLEVRQHPAYRGALGLETWIAGRRLIIDAILRHDEALARFEANRNNREVILAWLRGAGLTSP